MSRAPMSTCFAAYPFAYSIGEKREGVFLCLQSDQGEDVIWDSSQMLSFLVPIFFYLFFTRAGSLSNESSYCVLTELKLMRHLSPVLMTTIMLGNGAASPACPFTSWFWNQRVSVRAGTNRTTRVSGLLASWEALRIQSPMFRP